MKSSYVHVKSSFSVRKYDHSIICVSYCHTFFSYDDCSYGLSTFRYILFYNEMYETRDSVLVSQLSPTICRPLLWAKELLGFENPFIKKYILARFICAQKEIDRTIQWHYHKKHPNMLQYNIPSMKLVCYGGIVTKGMFIAMCEKPCYVSFLACLFDYVVHILSENTFSLS